MQRAPLAAVLFGVLANEDLVRTTGCTQPAWARGIGTAITGFSERVDRDQPQAAAQALDAGARASTRCAEKRIGDRLDLGSAPAPNA